MKISKQKFERIIQTSPPFDKRSDVSGKNYGVGALQLRFVLKGREGAVQILFGTKLYLAKQMKEWKNKEKNFLFYNDDDESIDCWDVGFHSKKKPDYMQICDKRDCDILGKCYYDGSSLRGRDDKVVENYIEHGDEWIWKYLEDYYKSVFFTKDAVEEKK